MAINKITNTPILQECYNQRAIIVNSSTTKNCVRQSNGTLWVLLADHAGEVQLLTSIDNGFSWTVDLDSVQSGLDMREVIELNSDGFFGYLLIEERWDHLDLIMGEWESVGSDGSVERKRYGLAERGTVSNTTVLDTTDNPVHAQFDVSYNHEQAFLVWDGPNAIRVTRMSPRTTSISSDLTLGGVTAFNFISSCLDDAGHLDILFLSQTGGTNRVSHVRYDSLTPSFGSVTDIIDFGDATTEGRDLTIARDGLDTVCAFWSNNDISGSTVTIQYSISIDGGATWSAATSLSRTSGHDQFTDSTTGDEGGRTNLIGGAKGGFIISYVEDDAAGVPKTYVRRLTTSDSGATYTLEEEKEIATSEAASTPIVGLQWFHPPDIKLLDISDPGLVRVAYQAGEGNDLTQNDTKSVKLGQELLSESAYPTSLATELSTYTLDVPDSSGLRILFNQLGGPISNVDYYALGVTGKFTTRYVNAFNKIGTSLRLLKYEPDVDDYLSDISAYGAPTELNVTALFDPVTYSFPSPALTADDSLLRIETDVRKLHLPPTQHLARQFVVNKGGFLKRTVYVLEYDGNQYEISQVIPRFISSQICYYECNAYVVGPSRDPWSRVILPSET
jgi:hypothetical protein